MKRNIFIALLILVAAVRLTADGKMYWRETVPPKIPYQRALIIFNDGTEPQGFFNPLNIAMDYICKFKSTLSPSEMNRDIIFTPAKDNTPYREHLIRW